MTFFTLRTLLNLSLVLLIAAAVLLAAKTVISVTGAEPFQGQFAIMTDRPVERPVLGAHGEEAGSLRLSHGKLAVRVGGPAYALQLINAALILAAALIIIWQMRKILIAIAAGKAFDSDTIRRLRLIGFLQLAAFAWIILEESAQQAMLLGQARMPDGAVLLSSLSWSRTGVENIQLDFTIDLGWVMGGLIALVIAEAFRLGAGYREDSDAVV